ncbi:NDP-hexose 2,3-dehydratase family protein [Actinacidiphila bryophytorum]|uniref:NDP-hexose 2,3-dehydratase family protein n=1 Tax=Actinacidiphila bryophytorum TaxID=1436133 RepID=UPI00396A8B59
MRMTTGGPGTRPRPLEYAALSGRLGRSLAHTAGGAHLLTADVAGWLDDRLKAHRFRVDRIPLQELRDWSFDPSSGNLAHASGRFFTVEGLRATVDEDPAERWEQPIIVQPEVGILGILAKEFDGVLHFLMQAKMEPGNPNLLQLSPTVQATRSNYTKVHRGGDVRYLGHFTRPEGGRVLADVLQSEHGSWFFRKANRNMLVEALGDVPPDDDFCWLTLGQIGELLREDNVVNMDARTILGCVATQQDEADSRNSDTDLLSWLTAERCRRQLRAELMPLRDVDGWVRTPDAIERPDRRYFRVVAASVQAGNREVESWSQPLFEPVDRGVCAFVTHRFHGVPHVLANARVEGGFLDTMELGPTVQCVPGNYLHLPQRERPMFLDAVLEAGPDRIRYEAVHSEEGGRFLNAESRYLFVEADERTARLEPPPGFCWMTPGQLTSLLRHSRYVNVQARTLLSCLNTGAAAI